jgi:hypothetical protein
MLNQNNQQQNATPYDLEECENIKIEHGVVALDYDAEIKAANEAGNKRRITLPGGRTIEIKEERLKCAELLFAPTL